MENKTDKDSILIINLSRIGDILQTIQALKNYRQNYPNYHLTFIGRKNFTEPLLFLLSKIFDKIFYLEDISPESLTNTFYNKIYNLTYSDFSSYFTSKIKCNEVYGLTRNKSGELFIPDEWSQYIFSNVMRGAYCPFSLVDIFKFILKNHSTITPFQNNFASNIITIHPFASQDKKKWPTEKWSHLINGILMETKNLKVFLVGSKEEQDEASNLVNQIHPSFKNNINNIVGQHSVEETIKLIRKSRLFIGHDSMLGHLMALYKIQTITISLGTVRYNETTPYGLNNYNLIPRTDCFPCFPDSPCNYFVCHNDLKTDRIVKFITSIINRSHNLNSDENHSNILQTVKKNDLISTTPIEKVVSKISQLFEKFYFIIWSFVFEEKDIQMSFREFSISNPLMRNDLEEYLKAANKILNLYQFAEKYIFDLLDILSKGTQDTVTHTELTSIQEKIKEIDELAMILISKYPLLSPIVNYIFVALGNSKGNNLNEIASKSALVYKEGVFICQIMIDFIDSVLKNISTFQDGIDVQNTSPKKEF